jgi:ferredoxin-NADP reductase
MSLATSPTRPHLQYAVRVSSSWYKRAFAALQPGDDVAVFGPIGDFVLDETRPAILVAGGIGVTPLKGMAEYATARNCSFRYSSSTAVAARTKSCTS